MTYEMRFNEWLQRNPCYYYALNCIAVSPIVAMVCWYLHWNTVHFGIASTARVVGVMIIAVVAMVITSAMSVGIAAAILHSIRGIVWIRKTALTSYHYHPFRYTIR
jgi:hypothetical protein